MTTKSKTPQIRFKGFSEEWENAEIGDYADIIAGGTPSTSNPTYWNPKQIPWMSSGEINKKRLFFTDNQISEIGLENSSAKWIKSNCVLIALAGQGKTRGTVAINHIPLTTNQSIAAIVPNEKLYFEFLYQNLENRYDELRTKSSGDGSRGGLNKQIISQISIDFPEITEQTKIGDYFQHLDKLIEQKEQKYQKLRQFKTAMLSKMFPQNGAATPEIHFKGFSGEWREKELHQIVNLCSGRDYKHLSNGNIPVYGTGGYMLSVNQALSYDEDAIGIGRKGTIDKPYILKAPFWTVDTLFYAVPKEKNNLAFTYSLFQKINWKQKDESTGVPSLSKVTINSIQVFTPEFDEQTKIGNYFQKLDTLIDLHAQELDKLRHIKKASLEKMFV